MENKEFKKCIIEACKIWNEVNKDKKNLTKLKQLKITDAEWILACVLYLK